MALTNLNARLGAYAYVLLELQRNGTTVVTSMEIGDTLGINPTQVRRDMSAMGFAGKRGVGYRPDLVLPKLAKCDLTGAGRLLCGIGAVADTGRPPSKLLKVVLVGDLAVERIEDELAKALKSAA